MNSAAQSTLARLLAKENITIQHGNYTTAFFDVQNRVLGLPMWKDKTKDVYDLLVGHEVGHALFTPRDFHLDSRGARQDYINLVEDVRIERKVQTQYPGLVGCFTRGYSTLKTEDFFGINHKNVNNLGLADRLNLKFKLRNLIDIAFSPAELAIFEQIERAETWDEVVAAALDLEKFIKETRKQNSDNGNNQSQESQQPSGGEQNDSADEPQIDPTAGDSADQDNSTSNQQTNAQDDSDSDTKSADSSNDLETDSTDASGEGESKQSDSKSDADKQDSESTENDGKANSGEIDPSKHAVPHDSTESVTTQQCFDENTRKHLVDSSRETLNTSFAVAPTTAECMENVLAFSDLMRLRRQNPMFADAYKHPDLQSSYQQFLKSTRKIVSMLAKEFELRKAAYQYARATVSKTGSLNLNKLHAYKVSDDLFLSVTKLADSKNHGMVMFVDYSGSMTRQLPHVLRHLINMALFCRQVGIPFAVYAFTSDNGAADLKKTVPYFGTNADYALDKVVISNTILIELVSSNLSKTEFNDAIYSLYLRSRYDSYCARCETLGNTPLNETVIIAHDLIKQFRTKHNPDKMTAIFLTDGSGHALRVSHAASITPFRSDENPDNPWQFNYRLRTSFKLNGRTVNADSRNMTPALMENLRITTNTETIGFFIPGTKSQLRNHAADALSFGKNATSGWSLWTQKFERIYKDEQVISIPGAFNYSNYFIVASGDDLAVDEEELEVTADMTRGRIARAFMNYSSSKKTNRVFVTKFAQAIA